jgi:hypothetical protein
VLKRLLIHAEVAARAVGSGAVPRSVTFGGGKTPSSAASGSAHSVEPPGRRDDTNTVTLGQTLEAILDATRDTGTMTHNQVTAVLMTVMTALLKDVPNALQILAELPQQILSPALRQVVDGLQTEPVLEKVVFDLQTVKKEADEEPTPSAPTSHASPAAPVPPLSSPTSPDTGNRGMPSLSPLATLDVQPSIQPDLHMQTHSSEQADQQRSGAQHVEQPLVVQPTQQTEVCPPAQTCVTSPTEPTIIFLPVTHVAEGKNGELSVVYSPTTQQVSFLPATASPEQASKGKTLPVIVEANTPSNPQPGPSSSHNPSPIWGGDEDDVDSVLLSMQFELWGEEGKGAPATPADMIRMQKAMEKTMQETTPQKAQESAALVRFSSAQAFSPTAEEIPTLLRAAIIPTASEPARQSSLHICSLCQSEGGNLFAVLHASNIPPQPEQPAANASPSSAARPLELGAYTPETTTGEPPRLLHPDIVEAFDLSIVCTRNSRPLRTYSSFIYHRLHDIGHSLGDIRRRLENLQVEYIIRSPNRLKYFLLICNMLSTFYISIAVACCCVDSKKENTISKSSITKGETTQNDFAHKCFC